MAVSRVYFEFVQNQYRDASGITTVKAIENNIVSPPVEMLLPKVYIGKEKTVENAAGEVVLFFFLFFLYFKGKSSFTKN